VIRSRKMLRVVLVAIMIVGLMAVAIPLCSGAVCGESSSAMPAMPSHMALANLMQPVFAAACDMAVTVQNGVDSVLPSAGSNLLSGIGLALVVVSLVALVLLHQWTPRRAAAGLARILSPPGDLRGVRLLI
jgi:predicted cobalt transporter CbtA